jgi:hypothetical protein
MKEKEATRGSKAKKEQAPRAQDDSGFAEISSREKW